MLPKWQTFLQQFCRFFVHTKKNAASFLDLEFIEQKIEQGHSISYKTACTPCEDLDQTAHPPHRLVSLRCPSEDALDPFLPRQPCEDCLRWALMQPCRKCCLGSNVNRKTFELVKVHA